MLNKIFILGLAILSFSCSSNINNSTISNIDYISNIKVNKNSIIDKKDIKLTLKNNSFNTKQIVSNNYSNAILPKKYNDIEYVKVFLVTENNYLNPFEQGVNIFGDGIYKIFYKKDGFSNLIINDVPSHNTYRAIVSAFDNNNLNITKENSILKSLDNKWYFSSNNVTIDSSIIYSNQADSLLVDLYLEDGEGAKVDSSILIKKSEIDKENIQ